MTALLFLLGLFIGFPAGIGMSWLYHEACAFIEAACDVYAEWVVCESFKDNGAEVEWR